MIYENCLPALPALGAAGVEFCSREGRGDAMYLRMADQDDEVDIRACAEEAYQKYVARIGRKPAPMVADFATQIGKGWVRVAVDGSREVAGYIVFFPENDDMLLENVAVKPDCAGKGVGRLLMSCCELTARQLGCRSIQLYTNEKMTENLSLYAHLGYRETDRRKEDGFKRVYFEKRLD